MEVNIISNNLKDMLVENTKQLAWEGVSLFMLHLLKEGAILSPSSLAMRSKIDKCVIIVHHIIFQPTCMRTKSAHFKLFFFTGISRIIKVQHVPIGVKNVNISMKLAKKCYAIIINNIYFSL